MVGIMMGWVFAEEFKIQIGDDVIGEAGCEGDSAIDDALGRL